MDDFTRHEIRLGGECELLRFRNGGERYGTERKRKSAEAHRRDLEIVANRLSSDFHPGIFRQCSENKESVLRLDAELFYFDLVIGDYTVASKEGAHAFRRGFLGGEKRFAEFLFEIAVQVELGTGMPLVYRLNADGSVAEKRDLAA